MDSRNSTRPASLLVPRKSKFRAGGGNIIAGFSDPEAFGIIFGSIIGFSMLVLICYISYDCWWRRRREQRRAERQGGEAQV